MPSEVFAVIQRADECNRATRIHLGEFHQVWRPGINIGSDPRCTIVLPDLPPVAARVRAASNHKLLYLLPQGTNLPLPPDTFPVRGYDARVDGNWFPVGEYWIHFEEVATSENNPPQKTESINVVRGMTAYFRPKPRPTP